MNEKGEKPNQNPMDFRVDRAIETKKTDPERYSKVGPDGGLVADKHEKQRENDKPKGSSWTMGEIERMIATDTLRPSRTKLEQFATAMSRRSDLRMPALTRNVSDLLRRGNVKEMTTGPEANRVREFDLQSQTMRMIAANASVGTYQFQKNLVLPYMRKSLALSYQKVNLLKDVVSGIGSLEKAIVSKLEAIKVNTGAAAPRKKTMWKRLWDDVRFLNTRRVAGNISNFIMGGWDNRFRKHIAPATLKLHNLMKNTTPQGGANAVRRKVTGKLNNLRRRVREVSKEDTTEGTKIDKLKTSSAKIASKVLGGAVKGGQQLKLSEEANAKASGKLKHVTAALAKFNPFAALDAGPVDLEGDDTGQTTRTVGEAYRDPSGAVSKLAESFDHWRKEYRSDADKIIHNLSQINEKMGGRPRGGPGGSGGGVSPTSGPKPPAPQPIIKAVRHSVTLPPKPQTVTDKITAPITPTRAPAPKSAATQPSEPRQLTNIGSKLKERRTEIVDKFDGFTSTFKKVMAPFYQKAHMAAMAAPIALASPQAASAHVDTYRLHQSTQNLRNQANIDREFVTKMFDRLGNKVTEVTKAVDEGNDDRSRFEKIQTKWKALADRLRGKGVRKNSYEDLQEQRERKRREGRGFFGRAADRARDAVKGVGANLAQGNLVGAAGGLLGGAFDWAKDELLDGAGDAVKDKIGDLWDRRRSRRLGRGSLSDVRRSRGLLRRGATELAEELTQRPVKRSLARKTASLIGGAVKGTAKLGAKAAWGATKFGTKAGIGLAKAAPGLAVGATKLGWKAAKVGTKLGWGATKLATKAGWGVTKFGAKTAGHLAMDSAKFLGKGAMKLTKGFGPALAIGIGADYAQDWINKNTTGGVKRLGNTAASMAKYGAMGSVLGPWGAAAGAALGAVIANSDVISSGLKKTGSLAMGGLGAIGSVAAKGGNFLWTSLFGSKAKFDKNGKVKEQEKSSLLGSIKSAFFGQDAKYTKDGQLVAPSKKSFVTYLQDRFSKTFYGSDTKDKTSFFDSLGKKFSDISEGFSKGVSTITEKLSNGMSSAGSSISAGASGLYQGAKNVVNGAIEAVENVVYKMSGSTKENFKKILDAAKSVGDPHPEITAAQWALESNWGKSMSGKNNPFGQKARKGEPATMRKTWEVYGGRKQVIMAPFKDYQSIQHAIAEHVEKWTKRKTQPGSTPMQAAQALKAAGYATDPAYASKLGKILASQNIDPNKPFTGVPGGTGGKGTAAKGTTPAGKPTVAPTDIAKAYAATGGKAPALLAKAKKVSPVVGSAMPGVTAATFAAVDKANAAKKAAPTKAKTGQPQTAPTKMASATQPAKTTSTPTVAQTSKPIVKPTVTPVSYTPPATVKAPTAPTPTPPATASKELASLVKALVAQTDATIANTAAIAQHRGEMNQMRAVKTAANDTPPSTNVALMPALTPLGKPSGAASVSMSMAKTSVRTGNG